MFNDFEKIFESINRQQKLIDSIMSKYNNLYSKNFTAIQKALDPWRNLEKQLNVFKKFNNC